MSVTATRDWPRVLTPAEVAAIRPVMGAMHLRTFIGVLLSAGLRRLRGDERGLLAIDTLLE